MDLFPIQQLNAITVNAITDDATRVQMLEKKFSAELETMEGAALHYTCLQEDIPFLQLRSISNYVGERDKLKWKMKEAIHVLNDSLVKILSHLSVATLEEL